MAKVGILGAGAVGGALGKLFRDGGHHVVNSSRTPSGDIACFEDASNHGDVVVIAVPYIATSTVLPPLVKTLSGKIVVDATNALNDDWSPLLLGQNTSGAEEIAKRLPNSTIVKAFNTVFADIMNPEGLSRLGTRVTAFIAGDNDAARTVVSELAVSSGFAPIETGPLSTARYLEAVAHLNIAIAVGQSGGTNAAFIYDQAKA